MAGELTHIIPTHPSDPNYRASKTRGITWCDANGVAHTITAVYWSPTNNVNDRKLIWQLSNDVPYDNTCTATVVLSQNKTSWIVTIEKDGEDVTSSLSQMITWIYNGKGERVDPQYAYSNIIDLSQFPRGDYRLDLSRITSKAGGYFPGSGALSFPDHIYIGQLVAGDICVAIEYIPTNDITVDSLEIFSHETTSYTTSRIQIIHESGLYVGSFNGNGQDGIETRYSLEGRARTLNNVGTTLYKDEKYYIIFQDKDTSKWNTGNIVFKPAYFANEEGNYKANVYDNTDATTLHPYSNVKNIKAFLPSVGSSITEADLQSILKLDTNELFLWNGSNITINSTVIINDDHLGKKLTTKVANPPITTSDADIWTYDQYQVFVRHDSANDVADRIWRKTSTVKSNGTITTTKTDSTQELIEILLSLGNDTIKKALSNDTGYMLNNYIGYLFQLKSNYAPDSSLSYTPLTTLPAGTDYHFYYIDGNAFSTAHGTGLYVYENGDFTYIIGSWGGDINNFLSYFILTDESSIMEHVDFTTVVQEDQAVSCNTEVRDATVSNGRKYYLRINGNEV